MTEGLGGWGLGRLVVARVLRGWGVSGGKVLGT